MLMRLSIIILCLTSCHSQEQKQNKNFSIENETTTLSNIDVETTEETTVFSTLAVLNDIDVPKDCSQREKLKKQPKKDDDSHIVKCCPIGEGLNTIGNEENDHQCDSTNLEFKPSIINAVLFDNCIEDDETPIELPYEIGNPCNSSIIYTSEEDMMYVLQDGSLLIMDEFANTSYTVEKTYCLDIDNVSGVTYAIICITSVEEHIQRSQILTVAVLMLISVPCLLFVSYLHITIKDLRTLHGASLSFMSFSLAIGYLLHSIVHIAAMKSTTKIGYAVQFFVLSYFFWFFCLSLNVLLNIWFKIPRNKPTSKLLNYANFTAYCVISFVGALILVVITIEKGFPGMPSYFLQGLTESIRESQRYFIPPISTLLFLSFIVMAASFFGFQKIKKQNIEPTENTDELLRNQNSVRTPYDEAKYEEVKKDAKCISLLLIITITTWLLEIVTFYSPGPANYLIIMEMINGLQGVLIMLIFLVVRRRRTIILRWWYDRGTHNIEDVELTAINKPNSNNSHPKQ